MPNPVPEGYNTLSTYLVVDDAAAAIDFYKEAFGAEELVCFPMPDGKSIMHAELKIGNSHVMISDEFSGGVGKMKAPKSAGAVTSGIHAYVEDVDAAYQRALDAGATVLAPLWDAFWGDRIGKITDPFGHEWSLSSHIEDVTNEEIARRAKDFFANFQG